MKLFTGLALASVLVAGTACSEPASPPSDQSAADTSAETTQTVQLAEPESTFNLSLPGSLDESDHSGGLNLSFEDSPADDGLILGEGAFGEADFGSEPDLDLGLDMNEASAPAVDDDVIRLSE